MLSFNFNFILTYAVTMFVAAPLFVFGFWHKPIPRLHPVMRRGMAITGFIVMAIMFFVTTIKLHPMLSS